MKKRITLIMIVMLLLLSITVVAISTTETVQTVTFEPEFDKLANYMGYSTDEQFTLFHHTAMFMTQYCPDKESFSFIEQMILSGCDARTTMDIYSFYLTTNEDISIVKQIYDMVFDGEPITNRDIVFENAFNKITNNKCGVLTEDDVLNYLEKGLTVSDISKANILSRKGILTIQQILDKLINGTSWETIVKTVYGEAVALSSETSISSIAVASHLSKNTNKPINTILSSNDDNSIEKSVEKLNDKLQKKGYWKGKKGNNFDYIVKEAKKKGISEQKLTELLDKGYTEADLINTIQQSDCSLQTIDSVLAKEALK